MLVTRCYSANSMSPTPKEPYRSLLHDVDKVDNASVGEPSRVILKLAIVALLVGAVESLIALRLFSPDQPTRAIGAGLVALVTVLGAFSVHSAERTRPGICSPMACGSWSLEY